jgi:hypothetical protein
MGVAGRREWGPTEPGADPADTPVATAGGRPIDRDLFLRLLIRGRGADVLRELVLLSEAERRVGERGLAVTAGDVEVEYAYTLERLTDSVVPAGVTVEGATTGAGGPPRDRTVPRENSEGERMLSVLLAERNMSREEFLLSVRRNACLRKLASGEVPVSEGDIQDEYQRRYGERVQVRHIQGASMRDLQPALARVGMGEDFAEVAREWSAARTAAADGGLLAPFSLRDERIPAVLRGTADDLDEGEVSSAFRMGAWFHVIRMERRIPASTTPFDEARETVERAVRRRLEDEVMQRLHDDILREAEVEVHDPVLRDVYRPQR